MKPSVWITPSKGPAAGVLSAIAGVGLMIFSEWATAPFVKDESIAYFLTNLANLKTVTLALMALGAAGAFWFGRGR